MAHEIDFSNNRENMAYVGQVPWHGLGHSMDPDADLDQWRIAAGLDWTADKVEVYYKYTPPNDFFEKYAKVDNQYAMMRSDTKAVLGSCTDRYNPVQPADVVEFYRKLTDAHGFKMETMGALKGGKHIWGLARTNDSVRVMGQDQVDGYVLLATSYDRSMATRVMPTTVRVVCNNTLSLAYTDEASGTTFSHLTKFDVERALDTVLFKQDALEKFADDADKLAATKIDKVTATEMLSAILFPDKEIEEVLETTRSSNRLQAVASIYTNPKGGLLRSTDGTAWGLVNAVTEFVDYNGGARNSDNRLHSAWFGRGEAMKTRAMELLLEAA